MSEFNNFSEAKKNYYEFKKVTDENFEGLVTAITDYVSELEQQNAELVEALMYSYKLIKSTGLSIPQISDIIERATGLAIDEAIHKYTELQPEELSPHDAGVLFGDFPDDINPEKPKAAKCRHDRNFYNECRARENGICEIDNNECEPTA